MRSVIASFAVILLDLAGRALVDKVLALAGSPAMVAMWAQLQSVVELICAVALAGVAQGLTVLIAQARSVRDEAGLLRAALKLAPAVAVSMALLFVLVAPWLGVWLTHGQLSVNLLTLGALIGCITVLPGLMSAYWLGRHQQQRVLQFSLLGSFPLLMVALAVYGGLSLDEMALVQFLALLLVALPMGWYLHQRAHHAEDQAALRKLARFVPVGLAIGVMSPASMLLARGILAASLSWHDAGLMQALWRSVEWVAGGAAGVLSLIFLPRLSATNGTARFGRELRRTALMVLLPAAALLLLLFFYQRAVLILLYDTRFAVSDEAAGLFMLGCFLRIASWIFLYGLFAARRTLLIVAGEILSLPLFVFLLWLNAAHLSLEQVSWSFCEAYVIYLAFNIVALMYARPWCAEAQLVRADADADGTEVA